MKAVLRRTMIAWRDDLHGEVDFNELLVVNTLRETCPRTLDFLREYLRMVAGTRFAGQVNSIQNQSETFERLWNQEGLNEQPKPALIRRLLRALGFGAEENVNAAFLCCRTPQSIRYYDERFRGSEAAEYFTRMVNESLLEGDLRDQEVLAAIRGWTAAPSAQETLPRKLAEDARWGVRTGQFSQALAGGDLLLRLASHHLEVLRSTYGSKSGDNQPGFVSLWLMANERFKYGDYGRWLETEIEKAFPVSLRLVRSLYSTWAPRSVGTREREGLLVLILKLGKQHFGSRDRGDALAAALNPVWPNTLSDLIGHWEDAGYRKKGLTGPAPWSFLCAALIAALEKNPTDITAAVVNLLAKDRQETPLERVPYEFDQTMISGFLGNDAPEAMRLLSRQCELPDPLDEAMKTDVATARQLAAKWLGDRPQ
jgi:hypothetical protein